MKKSYSLAPGDKGEWVPAIEAVHLLARHFGSDRKAKKALVERLRDSAVLGTAWWIATGYDVGTPYVPRPVELPGDGSTTTEAELHRLTVERSRPDVSQSRAGPNRALTVSDGDVLISGLFWNMATKEDQKQWDWASGLFKCSYVNGEDLARRAANPALQEAPIPLMRMYAVGVHFHGPDVLRIIPAGGLPAERCGPEPSNRGRKRSPAWPRWIAEVISLHDEEGIELLTANRLIDQIEERMAVTGYEIPSRKTVYDVAVETLELLKERRANGG